MFRRCITGNIQAALRDTPVVLLAGARQTGKTTLVRDMGRCYTFDESDVLAAAAHDPVSFLASLTQGHDTTLVLDEVQFVPQIFPAIKLLVDRDRRPGRFLLTGSANVLLLPRLSESLAGRMEVIPLWPLAQSEIEAAGGNFVDDLFAQQYPPAGFPQRAGEGRAGILRRVVAGGYPEPFTRPAGARREAWFRAYLTTILQRDVREISNIEGLTQLPRLLELLAARSATALNAADIARSAAIPYTTLQRYLSLLQATYLIHLLPAWSTNLGNRAVKSPKMLLNDTGLAASLLRLDEAALLSSPTLAGPLFENFVAMELLKIASWSSARPGVFHWRTQTRQEVDLVLEGPGRSIAAVEVKASATVAPDDFRHLRALAALCGHRFRRGVVLYAGERALPFGPDLYAVPIDALWR